MGWRRRSRERRGFGPRELRTAVLLHKTVSSTRPDYFVRKVLKWRWIIFPWHFWEDLTGFVQGIEDEGIHTPGAVRREIKNRYGIDVGALSSGRFWLHGDGPSGCVGS